MWVAGELGDWCSGISGVTYKVELSSGKVQDDQRARPPVEGRDQFWCLGAGLSREASAEPQVFTLTPWLTLF